MFFAMGLAPMAASKPPVKSLSPQSLLPFLSALECFIPTYAAMRMNTTTAKIAIRLKVLLQTDSIKPTSRPEIPLSITAFRATPSGALESGSSKAPPTHPLPEPPRSQNGHTQLSMELIRPQVPQQLSSFTQAPPLPPVQPSPSFPPVQPPLLPVQPS